jgi:carboxyl-terminal processing protease
MKQRNYFVIFSIAAVLGGAIVGGTLGNQALATSERLGEHLRTFADIFDQVHERYMEEVDASELAYGAVRGMLRTLDPHSNFLDPKQFREMREEQRGSFSGLGIVISLRGEESLLTVISPIEGTPAHRAGLRAGDVISMIDGQETAGMAIDEALVKLRGKKGTSVHLIIVREGMEEPMPFTLVRDDIPTASIPYAYMLRPGVGYIKIKNFTQTTNEELDQKIRTLAAQGMERLILDLRANPGGLLEQAVKVASRFIGGGKMIVYTRGRVANSDQEYFGGNERDDLRYPLIVLVNQGSASASEIVAGAIQDHDRGLVVGETTWGKGLVQTVYPLSHDTGLALTTAKYYTPSGRLIQRDYRSLEDYLTYAEASTHPEVEREVRYTDSGRKVLGGGGISPDVEVKLPDASEFLQTLERRTAFFDFAVQLLSRRQVGRDFQVDDAVLAQFMKFLAQKKIEYTPEDIEADLEHIKSGIRAEVVGNQFGLEERSRVINERDPQIQRALELLPRAQEMLAALVREAKVSKAPSPPPSPSPSAEAPESRH